MARKPTATKPTTAKQTTTKPTTAKPTTAKGPTYQSGGKNVPYKYGTNNQAINATGTGNALTKGTLLKAGTTQPAVIDLMKTLGLISEDHDNVLTKQDIQLAKNYSGTKGNKTIGNATLNKMIADAAGQKASDDYYNQLEQMMQMQNSNQNAAIQNQANASLAVLENQRPLIQQSYEDAQKQAYIQNALGKNQMDDQLKSMGYSGGAAESTIAGLDNTFADNRLKATTERDNNLSELEDRKATVLAQMNSDLADSGSDYYNEYMSMMQNQHEEDLANQEALKTSQETAKEQAAEDKENKSVDKWNNSVYKNINKRKAEGYKVTTWTDSTGRIHFTAYMPKDTTTSRTSSSRSGSTGSTSSTANNKNTLNGYKGTTTKPSATKPSTTKPTTKNATTKPTTKGTTTKPAANSNPLVKQITVKNPSLGSLSGLFGRR